MSRSVGRAVTTTVVTALLTLVTGLATLTATASPARADNVVTPGNFTGYGFDQCLGPTQSSMNRWLKHSPFLSVGIYISGTSRACRDQPNLTPDWVATQLRKGWRLLPITLGPQASCQPRFPRYDDDVKINPNPGSQGRYYQARKQGRQEAVSTVTDARALGISAGSTLWYDLEGFDHTNTHCRESALQFLSGWTQKLHRLGYVSGVYSSVGSGILALDNARVQRPNAFTLPDMIWLARWDNVANTSSSYIREDGWRPGGRVKQYQGGHDETWGGVRINIDRNFLDVGRGSTARPESRCGGVQVDFASYVPLKPPRNGKRSDPAQVKAMQCLLTEQGLYSGGLNGMFSTKTTAAVRAWQERVGHRGVDRWSRRNWVSLLAAGSAKVSKFGSAGSAVRRIQRALQAADPQAELTLDGAWGPETETAFRDWLQGAGLPASPVANYRAWKALQAGRR